MRLRLSRRWLLWFIPILAATLLPLLGYAANDFWTHGSFPSAGSPATSASMRAELDAISAGFDKLPGLTGNGNKVVVVNSGGTALTVGQQLIMGGNLTISGAYATTITVTGTTTVTLPTSGTLATLAGTETLTNKTFALGSNTFSGTTAQFNTALSDNDFATLAGTETLTNKTLTAPVIATISNTGTVTLPTATDTLVARATTDTLTNKTISGSSNTITNLSLTTSVSGTLPVGNGGTGITSTPSNGQILIGNGSTYTAAALANGGGVGITNASGSITLRALPRGYLFGCTLSNNGTDATNDIDLSATCEATSEDSALTSRVLFAPGALTKRLDATWAAGTNQGGRSSSLSIANGTWHVCLIRVSGADDLGFDTSVTCANLVTDHSATNVRRIGSILREAGAIVAFHQDGDLFLRKASVLDVDTTNPGTSAVLAALSVPTGIRVVAQVIARVFDDGTNRAIVVTDADRNDEAPSETAAPLTNVATAMVVTGGSEAAQLTLLTNTSRQIRYRVGASDGATIVRIVTLGWSDQRGRLY